MKMEKVDYSNEENSTRKQKSDSFNKLKSPQNQVIQISNNNLTNTAPLITAREDLQEKHEEHTDEVTTIIRESTSTTEEVTNHNHNNNNDNKTNLQTKNSRFNVYQDLPELNRLRGNEPLNPDDEYFDPLPCSFPPHLLLLPITEKNTALIRASVYPNPQEESKAENTKGNKNIPMNSVKKLSTEQIQRTSIGIDGKPYALHPSPMESTPSRLGFNKSGKKQCPTRSYSDEITDILLGYFVSYREHPYPSQKDQAIMSQKCGLTSQQVRNWFVNIRKRHYYPLIKGQRQPRNYLDCLIYSKQERADEEFKWHTIFQRSAELNPNPSITNLSESPLPKVSTKKGSNGRKRPLHIQPEDTGNIQNEIKYIHSVNGLTSNQAVFQPSSTNGGHRFPTSYSDVNLHRNYTPVSRDVNVSFKNSNGPQINQTVGRQIFYGPTASSDRQPQSPIQLNQNSIESITRQAHSQIANLSSGGYTISNSSGMVFPSSTINVVNYPLNGLVSTPNYAPYPNTVNKVEEFPTNQVVTSSTLRAESRLPNAHVNDQNIVRRFVTSSSSMPNFTHLSDNGNLSVGMIENNHINTMNTNNDIVNYPYRIPQVSQEEITNVVNTVKGRKTSIESNGHDGQSKRRIVEKEVRILTSQLPHTNSTMSLSRNSAMDEKSTVLMYERERSRSNSMGPDGLYYDEEEANFAPNDTRQISSSTSSHSTDISSPDRQFAIQPVQSNTNLQILASTNSVPNFQNVLSVQPNNRVVYTQPMYHTHESIQAVPISNSISIQTNSHSNFLNDVPVSGISNTTEMSPVTAINSITQSKKQETSNGLQSNRNSFVNFVIANKSDARSRAQAVRRQRERLGRQLDQNKTEMTNSSRSTSTTELSGKERAFEQRKESDHTLSVNTQVQINEGESKNMEMRSSVSTLSLSFANANSKASTGKLSVNNHEEDPEIPRENKSFITKESKKMKSKLKSIESSGSLSTAQTVATHSSSNTKVSPIFASLETKNLTHSNQILPEMDK